jgi:hypothetical protein
MTDGMLSHMYVNYYLITLVSIYKDIFGKSIMDLDRCGSELQLFNMHHSLWVVVRL